MQEIKINENDRGQRLDRFLKKFLKKASLSFIYKSIRKKNIVVNDKKAKNDQILEDGDSIKIYFSDETIEKFTRDDIKKKSNNFPDIIYEDENIILMDKKAGILSHNDQKDFQKNMLDMMVDYLIAKDEYKPRLEKSFRPAISNRLDRNTSGILIGAKNAKTLRLINEKIKANDLDKYYICLVRGNCPDEFFDKSYLKKTENNVVKSTNDYQEDSKESLTSFKKIYGNERYSLLRVELITGRTHQIRTVLKKRSYPIVGDNKYGDRNLNQEFLKEYGYKSQFLHNIAIKFKNFDDEFSYLNNKTFFSKLPKKEEEILKDIFGEDIIDRIKKSIQI